MFTFGRVVQEEALEQLVLDGGLLCRVIGQDVFMAHIVQTWRKNTDMRSHGDETENNYNHLKWEVLCSVAAKLLTRIRLSSAVLGSESDGTLKLELLTNESLICPEVE